MVTKTMEMDVLTTYLRLRLVHVRQRAVVMALSMQTLRHVTMVTKPTQTTVQMIQMQPLLVHVSHRPVVMAL
jgi:hypothetical protein